jgi:hypothetical protein
LGSPEATFMPELISVDRFRDVLTVPMSRVLDHLRFVILSTGRAGSGSTAATLNCLGIPCGHESVFNPYTHQIPLEDMLVQGEGLMGDSSWPAVARIDELPEDLELFHLVRNPLKYVNSLTQPPGYWAGSGGPYTQLKRDTLPEIPEGPEELCSMIHWVRWNEMIEKRVPAERRFRLEDEWTYLLAAVSGVAADSPEMLEAISEGRTIRENKHRAGEALFQSDDLRVFDIYPEFEAKAEEYGYDLTEDIS